MQVYFNHRADLCDAVLRFGFTDDILRSLDYAQFPGYRVPGGISSPREYLLILGRRRHSP